MTELFESPYYIGGIGAAVVLILGTMWVQQGGRKLLAAALTAAVVTGLLLLVERLVETPREEIKSQLTEMASDFEQNDLQKIYSHISKTAPGIRARAEQEFPSHHFKSIAISGYDQVHFDPGKPPQARVTFRVMVEGDFYNHQANNVRALRLVKLTLVKEDGRWKVSDYDHGPPQRPLE